MYTPSHFASPGLAADLALMRAHPFAVLVACAPSRPEATHVPVLVDGTPEDATARFHLAAANPLVGLLDGETEALLVFHGPHAYISPDWYANAGQVPTWNYQAAHVYGRPRPLGDADLVTLLEDLSAAEEDHLPKPPWRVDRVGEDRLAAMRRAIVGFSMPIAEVQGKWKLNQNRGADDRAGAAAALGELGGEHRSAVAQAMRRMDADDG